jgi:hypothetical protein
MPVQVRVRPEEIVVDYIEIDPNLLLMSKPSESERTFSRSFAEKLASSIEADGLLEPPVVRPASGKAGFYEVVAGMHRVYACAKILKWAAVPCAVVEGMSDDQAAAAKIAENVFRNPLTNEQRLLAVKRWYELYSRDNPDLDGVGTGKYDRASRGLKKEKPAPDAAAAPAPDAPAGDAPADAAPDAKPAPAPAPEPARKPITPFSEALAETSGMSEAAARRWTRIAKTFTADQIAVLGPLVAAKKLKLKDLIDMSMKLATPEARAKAVALLASGMDPAEALRHALALLPAAKSRPKTDDDLTDEEWLQAHCSKQLGLLKKAEVFKSNALMYRRLSEMRNRFRTASKKVRAEFKASGVMGPFYMFIQRTAQCKHPSHWAVCASCGGTGFNKDTKSSCQVCYGAAFKVTSDPES